MSDGNLRCDLPASRTFQLDYASVDELASSIDLVAANSESSRGTIQKAYDQVAAPVVLKTRPSPNLQPPTLTGVDDAIARYRAISQQVAGHSIEIRAWDTSAWGIFDSDRPLVIPGFQNATILEQVLGFSVEVEDSGTGSVYSTLDRYGDWFPKDASLSRNQHNDAFAVLNGTDHDRFTADRYGVAAAALALLPALRGGNISTDSVLRTWSSVDSGFAVRNGVSDSKTLLRALSKVIRAEDVERAGVAFGADLGDGSSVLSRIAVGLEREVALTGAEAEALSAAGFVLKSVGRVAGPVGVAAGAYVLVHDWGELSDGDTGADDVAYVAGGVTTFGSAVLVAGAIVGGGLAAAPVALPVGVITGIAGGVTLVATVIDGPDPEEVRRHEILLAGGLAVEREVAPGPFPLSPIEGTGPSEFSGTY